MRSKFAYYAVGLRTSHLEPYRTSVPVPYFSSIIEAHRTNVPYPNHYTVIEKAYCTSILYFFAKIYAYRTVPTYRIAILAFEHCTMTSVWTGMVFEEIRFDQNEQIGSVAEWVKASFLRRS